MHPLATQVQYVKGVGPVLASKLGRMGIFTVADLLSVIPIRYIDRRNILKINKLTPGKEKTIIGTIEACGLAFIGKQRKRIFEIIVKDDTAHISAKWFHFRQRYMQTKYKIGAQVMLSGEASFFSMSLQFIHPDIEIIDENDEKTLERIIPVYPLTEGLYQKTMRKIIKNAWDKFNYAVEPVMPEYLIDKLEIEDPWKCLQELHFPGSDIDIDNLNNRNSIAHRSLIFDELFFLELGLAIRRNKIKIEPGISHKENKQVLNDFFKTLSFKLTNAQTKVIKEICRDLEDTRPMNRLLQGDVGSGKTVVAIAASLQAIYAGYQVAFMAPTEILAEQHYETIRQILSSNHNIKYDLLTSNVKGETRTQIYNSIKQGDLQLIIGTHALIQDDVVFKNLGLAIVDEQHRFGVLQRAAIVKKGLIDKRPDLLIMTATPIPRTLAMTLYGDLDVSILDEMPLGRKPIMTKLYDEHKREKLYNGIMYELKNKKQIYVVYPLIEETEKSDLKDATNMKNELASIFEPEFKVELLHGRMKGDEKERIMRAFKAKEIDMLVTTSVVEVGVDVPNATVMVIEHAERFGLSQLHQLRGRVGRSEFQSYCILMADYKRSEDAIKRLKVMVDTTDGFKIAEEDLNIRGPGEFIGTRQAGIPEFRIANLARDIKLLSSAREAAFNLIKNDPDLTKPEHKMLAKTLNLRWAGKLELAMIS